MRDQLGPFERRVLQVLIRHPSNAYGISILKRLEALGLKSSVGALYTTLERLEGKGYVSSSWGEPTAERGGRRKRFYQITAAGALAEQRSELAQSAFATLLNRGVPNVG